MVKVGANVIMRQKYSTNVFPGHVVQMLFMYQLLYAKGSAKLHFTGAVKVIWSQIR